MIVMYLDENVCGATLTPHTLDSACLVVKNPRNSSILKMNLNIITRVHSAFSLVASCVSLKYTRTDDVN